jgi:hypothetical protein
LQVAFGFVGNYAPYGLSPQIDGMPVILNKTSEDVQSFRGFRGFIGFRLIRLLQYL